MAFWRKRYTSKHTGKEIDDAVDAVGSIPENIMANPMTAAGDLIVGGTDGEPARLAKGTAGQVLKMNAGATAPEWAADSEGMANPMTAAGDIIVGGADGAPERLAKGTAGQVLKMNAGATAPEWAADSEGMTNPMTAQGDMIVGGNNGTPSRLAAPSNSGDILSNTLGVPVWSKMLPCYTANPATDPVIPSGQCAICIVSSEPATKYNNIIYIITGA